MTKASDYKEHSVKMKFEEPGVVYARVLTDGTLHLQPSNNFPFVDSGMKPETALALGRFLVDLYEEKPILASEPIGGWRPGDVRGEVLDSRQHTNERS